VRGVPTGGVAGSSNSGVDAGAGVGNGNLGDNGGQCLPEDVDADMSGAAAASALAALYECDELCEGGQAEQQCTLPNMEDDDVAAFEGLDEMEGPDKRHCRIVVSLMKPFGLVNLGATCYLNAAVGVLASCGVLSNALVERSYLSPCLLLECLQDVFQLVAREEGAFVEGVESRYVFDALGRFNSFFESKNTHHDVQECLNVLLECIELGNSGLGEESFGIRIGITTCCVNGSRSTENVAMHSMLIVSPLAGQSISSLLDCYFAEGSLLDDVCAKCGLTGKCRRVERVVSVTGTSLGIFILRAESDGRKNLAPVVLSETVSLAGQCFMLSCVVVHNGATSRSGHYWYFRRVGMDWFKVDDDNVFHSSLADVVLNLGVMCNVAFVVYDRTDGNVRLSRDCVNISGAALCLAAFCGKFASLGIAKSFLEGNGMRAAFPHSFRMGFENRDFALYCGGWLLEMAMTCTDLACVKNCANVLQKCIPELDVGSLGIRLVPADIVEVVDEGVSSTPKSQTDSESASQEKGKKRERARNLAEDSDYDSDDSGSSSRVPIRKLERLLARAVSKGSSSESRAVKRCTKRVAEAVDEALKVQAQYKGLEVSEVAKMVAEKSQILRQLECGGELHKLAQLGQAVLEFGVLACAEESRSALKELVSATSAQTFLLGLCRNGGLNEGELRARGLSFSHSTFVNAGTVMMHLRDVELREQALQRKSLLQNIPKGSGRPRGVFSFSRTNPVPLLPPRASNRMAAVIAAIVANSVVAPAHFVARLGKSSCPLDLALRSALGVDSMVQLRLQVEESMVFEHYRAATPPRVQYSESYFLSLLASTELIVKNEMKAGVCNKCFMLDETLEWIGHQAQHLLSGVDRDDFKRLLLEVRMHIFRGQLQHLSSRSSLCSSHNPAFVLGEPLPVGIECHLSCLACEMVVALAKKLCSSCCGNKNLQQQILTNFRLVAFLLGHNVLKSDAEQHIRSCHDLVDSCQDGSLAVLYLDMMMKILPMVPHESKEKWYGKVGWISQVAAIYWRPPSQESGLFFYVVLENWQIQKSNAGVILALFDATLKELKVIAPQVKRVVLVTDDGPNYSSNECVVNFPHFALNQGMVVTEMVVMEGGSGKGPHDAIGGAIQSCIRQQVALGRNATTTRERLQCLTRPDGSVRVKNTLVALVTVDCANYNEKKRKGASAKNKATTVGPVIKGINGLFWHAWTETRQALLSKRTVLSTGITTLTSLPKGWQRIPVSGSADKEVRAGIGAVADLTIPTKEVVRSVIIAGATPLAFSSDYAKPFVTTLVCPLCSEAISPSYSELFQHFVKHHFRFGPATCVCGMVFSRKAHSFADHVLVHHLKLVWQCVTCLELCDTGASAEEHCQLKRFSQADQGLTCATCLKAYKTEVRFRQHEPRCRDRLEKELQKDKALKKSIHDCLATMPGMALFGSTLRPGIRVNSGNLTGIVKTWSELDVDVKLFERGFGKQSVWKELNPSHRKPWIEVVLLVVLWHVGALKMDFFRKGDSEVAAKLLDFLGCKGHSPKKIGPYFVSITKEQKTERARQAFKLVENAAVRWVRDGLIGGDRQVAFGVPLALYSSDLFADQQKGFLPYFKADLSPVALVALFGMAFCTAKKLALLDVNDVESDDVINYSCASALVALNRLYAKGSANVPLWRVELFFALFNSIVGPARLLDCSAEDSFALQKWLSAADDQDEWRGVLVPKKLSFLSKEETLLLKAELESEVYPFYCTCNTMLGKTPEKYDLMACEAAGGCIGRRWFHRECGHEPDDDGVFVCQECTKAAEPEMRE
jgi:hypothetical protein